MASSGEFADLMTIMVNIGSVIPSLLAMMQTIVLCLALYMVGKGLVELWGSSNDNASRWLAGNNRFSAVGGMVKLFMGGVLASMYNLDLIPILSNTVTGGYVMPPILSYDTSGSGFDAQAQAATLALLSIMQAIGFVAMCKGWLAFNAHYDGRSQVSLTTAFTWLAGGILCWNFKWATDVLNNTLGFEVFGLFGAITG